jgi:Predicted unsaturated glucuronyl hydrolase involved in regulation of bacterial surface properties, and related proteins
MPASDWLKAALATLALTSFPAAAQTAADILIRHVTVVDVEHGRTIPDQAVVTSANDIVAVGSDAAIAKSWKAAKTLDARGRYLIPGLWDMHVHFGGGVDLIDENRALLPLYVAHGITTVRDASGDLPTQVLEWRGEIARGALFGPTLLSSGPKIEGLKPIWKGTIETGSEADVDAALQQLQSLKVDFVKITDSTLEPELFLYAVRKARAAGLRTSGHIPMALTVRQAVDAGLSSIEHLDYAFDAGAKDEAAIAAGFAAGKIDRAEASRRLDAGFDRATAMAMYRYLAAKKVFVTPTLNGSRIIAWLDRDKHDDDEYLQYIGPKLRKTYEWRVQRAAQADAAAVNFRHAHFDHMAAVMPMLQEAGVTIMAGTDAGFLNSFNYPGIGLHDELALYVEKGLTPAQALAAATRAGPAWFDKLDRYGSLAKGKAADLVVLERNPLEDIRATRSIDAVVLRGKLYDRAALDQMLVETRQKVAAAAGDEAIDAARTLALMERVADWQLAHLEPVASIKVAREETRSPRSWQQGAFYAGLTALAERSESPRFRDAVFAHGRSTDWQLGDRRYHADDHVIGQSYLWAAAHGAGPEAIAPLRKRFDEILAAPPRGGLATKEHESCDDRWCWCDALFMAPPVWIGLAAATGDQRYAEYAHAEFKATRDYLYDPADHLFYRDSRFFEQRDSNGRKLFWSRGNGWVFAGIARVLERLPAGDAARPMYEDLFKEMAAKLKAVQKPDGYWAPSLLAAPEATPPESSGTGFFVYGMAWGIATGLLDRAEYEPVVRRGWHALERAVQADGMLGSVQQVSDRPDQVAPSDTQFYGVGAFLLAGSAVRDLYR